MDEKDVLIKKYFNMVYKLALSQTKCAEKADDVVQNVFLRFIQAKKPFLSEEHVKAWLIRATINCSKSIFTTAWAKRTVPLDDNITFDSPEKGDVYYAVMELPQKYRAVIHLYYYENLSVTEISEDLHIKENTVKSQLKRGREMLKKKLKGGYDFV